MALDFSLRFMQIGDSMAKIANLKKYRETKDVKTPHRTEHAGFEPCSPDMTICGDCADNRAKKKCPRLAEWLARRQERE